LKAPDTLTGLNALFKNMFIAGWGKMSLENPDLDALISKKPVSIIEENGFFAYLSQRDGAENLTPFGKGVLTGLFDVLRRTENSCEMEILSKDPLKCRYTVSPLS
jgi:hypothetical protein